MLCGKNMFKNKKHTGKGHESGKVQSWAVFLELRQKRIVYLICFLEQIIIPILERASVSGGENIYPVQIEDFLRKHDKIKDVAVIGLPDRRLGEKTAAIIEIKDGMTCTEEEIENFCLELPRYKRPKQIIFHEIPRNATGKIEKPKLREMYGADKLVEKENEA